MTWRSNGKTPGITLPDAKMQAAVIKKAYQNAGLSFSDTDYVECHGTGTPVGDPIEVDGIAACFAGREGEPLRIGSVRLLPFRLLVSSTDCPS